MFLEELFWGVLVRGGWEFVVRGGWEFVGGTLLIEDVPQIVLKKVEIDVNSLFVFASGGRESAECLAFRLCERRT
jgi:hypothetical protein